MKFKISNILQLIALTLSTIPLNLSANEIPFEIQSYADTYGVTVSEAKKRIERQGEIGDLNEYLSDIKLNTFAGLFIQTEPTYGVKVLVKKPRTCKQKNRKNWKKRRSCIKARWNDQWKLHTFKHILKKKIKKTSWASLVKIQEVESSLHQLENKRNKVLNILANLDEKGDISLDILKNRVELFILDKPDFEFKLKSIGLSLPKSVSLIEVESLVGPAANVYAGDKALDCTFGFAVKHKITGEKGILTAGHCDDNQLYGLAGELEGEGGPVNLTYKDGIFNYTYDYQWHTLPANLTPVNRVKTGEVFGIRTFRTITGTQTMPLGANVCIYGNISGGGCGKITNLSFANRVQVSNLTRSIAAEGDSGGPVYYAGSKAVGIISYVDKQPNSSGIRNMYYMPIERIGLHDLSVLIN